LLPRASMSGRMSVVLWGYVITGAVGIAGTALGSWLTGRTQTNNLRLSIRAESDRAKVAEKRRIYSRCLAAFGDFINAQVKLHSFTGQSSDSDFGRALLGELTTAASEVFKTANELLLIAPKDVGNLADSASDALTRYPGGDPTKDSRVAEYRHLRDQLILAMRADLGELD
jgi:hypothetical protein